MYNAIGITLILTNLLQKLTFAIKVKKISIRIHPGKRTIYSAVTYNT